MNKRVVLDILASSPDPKSVNTIEKELPQEMRVSELNGGMSPSRRRKIISNVLKSDPIVFQKVRGGYKL